MRYMGHSLIGLLTLTLGALAAASSRRLGRRVWSPKVFAWRNILRRPPRVESQPASPLLITNPRHYAFASLGSAVGGVLRYEIVNRSQRPVHSYACRHYSAAPHGDGAYGSQPSGGLAPGQSCEDSLAAHHYVDLTLTIDFVQFADGTTWFSDDPRATVKPEGIRAGAQAAFRHLLGVLERDGAEAVLAALPRIHADVRGPFGSRAATDFGGFGFYSGVTNASVRVRDASQRGGADALESLLRATAD